MKIIRATIGTLAIAVLIGFFGLAVFTPKVEATSSEWSQCVSTGPQCGTDNGTQYHMVCPEGFDYHYDSQQPDCRKYVPATYKTVTRYADKTWIYNDGWKYMCSPNGADYTSTNSNKPCSKQVQVLDQSAHYDYTDQVKEYRSCNTGEIDNSACVVDVCENLEGDQVETPQGYTNDDGYCYIPEEPVDACPDLEGFQESKLQCVEETPETTPSEQPKEKDNTFHKDTRCLATTPPAVSWINIEDGSALNNWHPFATWSAMGGDTIEVRFSENPEDLRWRFTMSNDGHEIFGYVDEHNTGLLGMINYYYQFRTVNDCKVGPWSETVRAFN